MWTARSMPRVDGDRRRQTSAARCFGLRFAAMHAYPSQLADFVLAHWPKEAPLGLDRRALMEILSICYQASLAHEEGRPVRFRLVSARAAEVTDAVGWDRFLPLEFSEPQPLTPDTLRRLSPAAPFHASLIGVAPDAAGWSIWGLVHSGAEWLAPTWGGRDRHQNLNLPQVHVLGAGRLGVYAGDDLVATLERGMVEATTRDVFTSAWLPALFRGTRTHSSKPEDAGLRLADAGLVGATSQHMVRRAIFLIRQAGHGGMILFADSGLIRFDLASVVGPLKLKYSFVPGDARERYRTLLERLIETLGKLGGDGPVDLPRFLNTETPEVSRIEGAIFEVSRLVAGLAAVDGAVVLSKRFELIGFGAEVSGELPYPDTVWEALDVEAERRSPEAANTVGTRHRAAYRFVTAHPPGLAIVISHDGIVRFVANLDGQVVYWDQFLNW
jgi:hypothetical protein